jgi:sugar lactone lactonase YvrE
MDQERTVRCVFDGQASLGESPLSGPNNSLYWVDINARELHRYTTATPDTYWKFDEEIGCVALGPTPDTVVVALRNSIELFNVQTQEHRRLAKADDIDPKLLRFNDGKCDARGRLWVGTYDEDIKTRGGLYCLDLNQTFTKRVDDIAVANGLAWSPDNRIMYHTDSLTNIIYAYDYDLQTGTLGTKRIFADLTATDELPDGAAIDQAGNYWVAIHNRRKIAQFSPSGKRLTDIAIPVPQPSMVAFGGTDYKTLYITTARQNLSEEELLQYPEAGGLFALQTEYSGQPSYYFAA